MRSDGRGRQTLTTSERLSFFRLRQCTCGCISPHRSYRETVRESDLEVQPTSAQARLLVLLLVVAFRLRATLHERNRALLDLVDARIIAVLLLERKPLLEHRLALLCEREEEERRRGPCGTSARELDEVGPAKSSEREGE